MAQVMMSRIEDEVRYGFSAAKAARKKRGLRREANGINFLFDARLREGLKTLSSGHGYSCHLFSKNGHTNRQGSNNKSGVLHASTTRYSCRDWAGQVNTEGLSMIGCKARTAFVWCVNIIITTYGVFTKYIYARRIT